jgi:hypothetical protein
MAAQAASPEDAADLDEGDEEETIEELLVPEPGAERISVEAAPTAESAVEVAVPPVQNDPESASFPSPGPAPEPTSFDPAPAPAAAAPTDDSDPGAAVLSSEPKTPEH